MSSLMLLASILWKLCPGQNPKLKFAKGNTSKNSWNIVMDLLHNVILSKLCPGQDFVTHGQTDGQSDSTLPPPNFVCGGIITRNRNGIEL